MATDDGDLEVDMGSSLVRDRPHNEHGTGSVETGRSQNPDQTGSTVKTGPTVDIDEAPLSIVESSEQTLVVMTVLASSLIDLGEDSPATIDISELTTARILNKRSSPSGVEYKCERLWLTVE
jgi:hypothetical protein